MHHTHHPKRQSLLQHVLPLTPRSLPYEKHPSVLLVVHQLVLHLLRLALSAIAYLREAVRLLRIHDRRHRLERQIPLVQTPRPRPLPPLSAQSVHFLHQSRAQRAAQPVLRRLPHLLQQLQHVQLLHALLHQLLQRAGNVRTGVSPNEHGSDLVGNQTVLNPHLQHQTADSAIYELRSKAHRKRMRQILRIPSDSLSRRTSSSTSRRSAYLPLISGIPEILHNSAVPGLLGLLPVEPAPAPLVELVAVGHRVSVIDGDEEEGVPLGCAAFSADHDVGVVAVGVHQIHVQKGDFLDFKSAKFGRGPVGNEVCVLHEFLQRTDLVAEVRMALREKGVANVGLHERKSKGPTWTVLGTAKMWP